MKLSLAAFSATILLSLNLLAAPATTYLCVGDNSATKQAVTFVLTFSDWSPETSYTNESIMITRIGWETLLEPVVYQMKGATISNNCQANEFGEIYMNGAFEMEPTEDGDIAPYRVNFTNHCDSVVPLDVKAYCFLE